MENSENLKNFINENERLEELFKNKNVSKKEYREN